MQFLFPLFLLSLFLIAIPVIIHLFHFRRYKKVFFTNVRFLKEIKQDSDARSKLKKLLTLLARCLAVIALVFAFAQPYLKENNININANRWVSIYLDNSFSMLGQSEEVPLLELARKRATDIVKSYKISDRFQILTNDLGIKQQRWIDQETAIQIIQDVKIGPNSPDYRQIINKQGALLNNIQTDPCQAYLISDFQISGLKQLDKINFNAELNLIPLRSVEQKNISIDSMWFESIIPLAGMPSKLLIQLTNHNAEDIENIVLKLDAEGQSKPVGSVSIKAYSTITDTIGFILQKTGFHEIKVTIEDYPIVFDDSYLMAFDVPSKLKTLFIYQNQPNAYTESALKAPGLFDLESNNIQQINYAKFGQYKLIVLEDIENITSGLASEITKYIKSGGSVVVFPGTKSELNSYQSFLSGLSAGQIGAPEFNSKQISTINTEEFIFKDVFEQMNGNIKLPSTKINYPILKSQQGEEPLLTYKDGQPFLVKYKRESGNLYVCSSPLDRNASDLVQNASIFVPMLYKMALSSLEKAKYSYTIGKDFEVELLDKQDRSEIKYTIKGTSSFIPLHRRIGNILKLDVQDQIRQAGYYALVSADSLTSNVYAFNFNRNESPMKFATFEELKKSFSALSPKIIDKKNNESFVASLEVKNSGSSLWRYLLVFALIALLLETFFIKIWRN